MSFLKYYVSILCILMIFNCSELDEETDRTVKITISVRDEIIVNKDTVSIDTLHAKLKQLGITRGINIRVIPDPEAGPATIEKVQRMVGLFKQSIKTGTTE